MKRIFKIDCYLYPLGLSTIITGFRLHIAGHGNNHHIWEMWALAHIVVSLTFLYLIIQHCVTHKAWVKSLGQRIGTKKRHPTLILTIIAAITCISGIALLAIMGANHSGRRLWLLMNVVRKQS